MSRDRMSLSELLAKIEAHPDIEIEKRELPDGTQIYIFASELPMPRAYEPRWYPLVIAHGQTEVARKEIDAMLRHLWQFQLDIFSDKEDA